MSKLTSVKKEEVEREQLFQNPWNILKPFYSLPIPGFSNFQSTHNLGADWATGAQDKEGEVAGSVSHTAQASRFVGINQGHVDQGGVQDKHGKRVQDQVIQKSLLTRCPRHNPTSPTLDIPHREKREEDKPSPNFASLSISYRTIEGTNDVNKHTRDTITCPFAWQSRKIGT